jgi:DNA-directed RNA polymerase subunit omega
MARVFVSDCLKNIPGRNDLVIMAAKHARMIPQAKKPLVPGSIRNRAVAALKEIEAGIVNEEQIIDNWYKSLPADRFKRREQSKDAV